MKGKKLFHITLKDIRPNQNRHRMYTIAVAECEDDNQYHVTLYWGKVGATKQRKIHPCSAKEELTSFLISVLKTRLKHGYLLVEKHPSTPNYEILNQFEQDSLYPINQLKLFDE